MIIGLLVGATLHPLAGEAGVSDRVHSGAGDFQLTPQSLLDVQRFVRGEHAVPIDRGNLLYTLAFTSARLFSTTVAAWLWMLDYDGATPRSGTLVLNTGGGTRYLTNAVVDPPRRRAIGCTVLLDYTVNGSEVTSTAP